jgi:hypothetical protein
MNDETNEQDQAIHYETTIPEFQTVGHQWREAGLYLICASCPFEHTTSPIGADGKLVLLTHRYTGLNEKGEPTFEKVA